MPGPKPGMGKKFCDRLASTSVLPNCKWSVEHCLVRAAVGVGFVWRAKGAERRRRSGRARLLETLAGAGSSCPWRQWQTPEAQAWSLLPGAWGALRAQRTVENAGRGRKRVAGSCERRQAAGFPGTAKGASAGAGSGCHSGNSRPKSGDRPTAGRTDPV